MEAIQKIVLCVSLMFAALSGCSTVTQSVAVSAVTQRENKTEKLRLPTAMQFWWQGYQQSLLDSIEQIDRNDIIAANTVMMEDENLQHQLLKLESTKAQLWLFVTRDLEPYLATVLNLVGAENQATVAARMMSLPAGQLLIAGSTTAQGWVELSKRAGVTVTPTAFESHDLLRRILCHEFTHSLVQSVSNDVSSKYLNEALTEYLTIAAHEALGWSLANDEVGYQSQIKAIALLMDLNYQVLMRWYVADDYGFEALTTAVEKNLVDSGINVTTATNLFLSWHDTFVADVLLISHKLQLKRLETKKLILEGDLAFLGYKHQGALSLIKGMRDVNHQYLDGADVSQMSAAFEEVGALSDYTESATQLYLWALYSVPIENPTVWQIAILDQVELPINFNKKKLTKLFQAIGRAIQTDLQTESERLTGGLARLRDTDANELLQTEDALENLANKLPLHQALKAAFEAVGHEPDLSVVPKVIQQLVEED